MRTVRDVTLISNQLDPFNLFQVHEVVTKRNSVLLNKREGSPRVLDLSVIFSNRPLHISVIAHNLKAQHTISL